MKFQFRKLIGAFLLMAVVALHGQTSVHYNYLPDNIYPDTTFAPFYYGVASGDPLQDRLIIWTKVFVKDSAAPPVTLKWQLANDSSFKSIVNSGTTICSPAHDFTTKYDVTGLQPGHHYFYRFITADGKTSQVGKSQTLPDDTTKHFKLALVSCSSVWSGYFNAYRRIAEREDIDFVLHVGDYIYDFMDRQEKIRVPDPAPEEPKTLADWRERHKYYLLDPDLRAARQNKTWIAEWDNHDSHYRHLEHSIDGITAFYDYLPVRMPDSAHPERIFRTFHFGKLADLNMIDMYLFRNNEEFAPGLKSMLGNFQDAWFKHELITSKATWHLIGNQEMMGSWMSEGFPKAFKLPGNGKYFDPKDWDGYPADRNRLYDFIDSNHINNFFALTGDAHMSFIIDLTKDPKNRKVYHRHTGQGSVGVEVLGPSITRGNMDERGVPRFLIPLIQRLSRDYNPHHRWVQFSNHGYTTIDVTPEKCVTEFWYSEILQRTDKETFGRGFVVKNGVNHWERKSNGLRKKSTHPL